jgi:pimeloyl-ACP methyl ester carboxylesterase
VSGELTFVLVHGAGCDRHAWDELAPLLGERVVALDLPGRRDEAGPPPASVAEAARWVFATIEARALRSEYVVLVGHSYGGAIAIECALALPLAALVLVATGARLKVHPRVISAMRAQAESSPGSSGALGWRGGVDPAIVARFDAATSRVPSISTLTDWLAANAFDRMADVARIATPTLAIGGTDDPFTPEKYARYVAEHVPGAELAILEGGGHMCIADDAPRVADCVLSFVRRRVVV